MTGPVPLVKAPPPVNEHHCDVGYAAFYRYGAQSKASTWILRDADPAGQNNNYITFAIAEDPGHSQYATAPPDEVLDRMFGKLSASNDADKGGLAIDPTEFMSNAPHHAWWRGDIGDDPCWWGSATGSSRGQLAFKRQRAYPPSRRCGPAA